jgi:hypothetical protein
VPDDVAEIRTEIAVETDKITAKTAIASLVAFMLPPQSLGSLKIRLVMPKFNRAQSGYRFGKERELKKCICLGLQPVMSVLAF